MEGRVERVREGGGVRGVCVCVCRQTMLHKLSEAIHLHATKRSCWQYNKYEFLCDGY